MKKTTNSLITTWWWRNGKSAWTFNQKRTMTKQGDGLAFDQWIWKDGLEWAAWSWELLRRHGEAPSLPAFTKLTPNQMGALLSLFGKSELAWVVESRSNSISSKPGYSSPAIWRLDVNDNVLVETFKTFIREQRSGAGITPKPGRASDTSQGPRWRYVELMDLAKERIRPKAVLVHGDFGWDQRRFMEAKSTAKKLWAKFTGTKPAAFTELLP